MNVQVGLEAVAEAEVSKDPELWAEAMATQNDGEGDL